MYPRKQAPNWLSEVETLLEQTLDKKTPKDDMFTMLENWYEKPHYLSEAENSPIQDAINCLSTEILFKMPCALRQCFDFRNTGNEEMLLKWIHEILNTGRMFQDALEAGEFDQL
jgi:hypothetical protein